MRTILRRLLNHHLIIALALFTLLWLLVFWRLWTPTATDRVLFTRGDFSVHYYSFSTYQAERMERGQFPLWNPYNYGGDPFAANVQWVAFYPPRWLALAAPGEWSIEALQWEVAAHYWLVNLLTYLFLCTLVKRKGAALAGSLLFTYGGYLTGYPMLQVSVIESVAWLPLLLLGVNRSVMNPGGPAQSRQRGAWGAIVGGTAVGLSFLAGHPQTTVQIVYCALAYLAVLGRQQGVSWRGIGWRAGLLLLVGAALAAAQLVPALEFIRLTSRGALNYADKANGFAFSDVLQMALPTLFGTWSPLYMGAAGLLLAAKNLLRTLLSGWTLRRTAFWWGLLVVSLLWAFGSETIVYDVFYVFVPGVNIFRQQERAAALTAFALSVLATYELERILAEQTRARLRPLRQKIFSMLEMLFARGLGMYVALLALATGAAAVWLLAQGEFVAVNAVVNVLAYSALMSGLFTAWYVWQRNYRGGAWPVVASVILLIVVDLFTTGTRTTNFVADVPANREPPPVLVETLSVQDGNVQWHVDGAGGIQGRGTYFRIPDIYGTGPFALQSLDELRTIPVERFWEVLAVRYVTAIDEPPVERVALNLLGYGQNYDGVEYRIFELLDPRPFAWLVYDVRVAEDNPLSARQIMSDLRVNLREMAVTTQPLPFALPVTRPAESAVRDFVMVTPERLEMTVTTSENALLTLALANYPGWRATVNGVDVPIIDTYAGLVGVPIAPGRGLRVVMEFVPVTMYVGITISLLTAAAILGYAGFVVTGSRRGADA
ncbi:MAG: YfhO family protein [Chloroflexi bacterium]|nr:YfhO family protein [Chloroflexota bacterium]